LTASESPKQAAATARHISVATVHFAGIVGDVKPARPVVTPQLSVHFHILSVVAPLRQPPRAVTAVPEIIRR
jgi:hypothetical protein